MKLTGRSVMDSLGIEGAWVYTPPIYHVDCGSFLEIFRGDDVAAEIGYQLNVAHTKLLGIATGRHTGNSFCRCPVWPGEIRKVHARRDYDTTADMRVGSAGFGKLEGVQLDDQNRRAIFISEGLATLSWH
jgi:dTDP-4-dehydrorhamnose 3,5-epimerase